jgi:hypothetical protein
VKVASPAKAGHRAVRERASEALKVAPRADRARRSARVGRGVTTTVHAVMPVSVLVRVAASATVLMTAASRARRTSVRNGPRGRMPSGTHADRAATRRNEA